MFYVDRGGGVAEPAQIRARKWFNGNGPQVEGGLLDPLSQADKERRGEKEEKSKFKFKFKLNFESTQL